MLGMPFVTDYKRGFSFQFRLGRSILQLFPPRSAPPRRRLKAASCKKSSSSCRKLNLDTEADVSFRPYSDKQQHDFVMKLTVNHAMVLSSYRTTHSSLHELVHNICSVMKIIRTRELKWECFIGRLSYWINSHLLIGCFHHVIISIWTRRTSGRSLIQWLE